VRLPAVVHGRVQTLLLLGPPAFGVALGGALVGLVRLLAGEPEPDSHAFVVTLSIAGVAAAALAFFLIGAVRVRRGAHTYFPRLWRSVPWTAAGGLLFGLVAAGIRALSG